MEKLKNLYLQHIQLKNYSPYTIRQNEQYLRLFLNFLRTQGINDIKQVKPETLEDYKKYLVLYKTLKEKSLAVLTINSRLTNIKLFFQYLLKKGYIYSDPAKDLILPREPQQLPRGIMSIEEIKLLLQQPNIRTNLGFRDRTILEVLYSTGIRAGELVRLKVSNIDFQKKLLRIIKGKGGKDRFVPLNDESCKFLKKYIEKIRHELAQCPRPCGHTDWVKSIYINY